MQLIPTAREGDRVFLTHDEYLELLEAADQDLRVAIRAGAHSMRASSVVGAPLSSLRRVSTHHGDVWLMRVSAKDSSDRPDQTKERDVFFSDSLVEDIHELHGEDYDGPMWKQSQKTLERRIRDLREQLATKTGIPSWTHYSFQDNRRYFATHLMYRHKVAREWVMTLGGWSSWKALQPYNAVPEDVIAREFGEKDLLNQMDRTARDTEPFRLKGAIDTMAGVLDEGSGTEATDEEVGQKELASKIAHIFDDEVLSVDDIGSPSGDRSLRKDTVQKSFETLDLFGTDDAGSIAAARAMQVSYVSLLTILSWALTIGA